MAASEAAELTEIYTGMGLSDPELRAVLTFEMIEAELAIGDAARGVARAIGRQVEALQGPDIGAALDQWETARDQFDTALGELRLVLAAAGDV